MSRIWVQQTCPGKQAEPFLTPALTHTSHLVRFLFVCLSLLDDLFLSLFLLVLFILHLIPCSRFSPCPSRSCAVSREADPRSLQGLGAPNWVQLAEIAGRGQ